MFKGGSRQSVAQHPEDSLISVAGPLIQLMGSLGHNRGGLTKAVYERLWAIDPATPITVAVTGYQPNVDQVFRELVEGGLIPARSKLRSYFLDLASSGSVLPETNREVSPAWGHEVLASLRDRTVEVDANGATIQRCFDSGRFVALARFDSEGELSYVDVHSVEQPQVPAYRDRYDGRELPHMRQFLDSDFRSRYQTYFDVNGGAYASHWVSPGGHAYRYVTFLDGDPKLFEDLDEARARWASGLAQGSGVTTFISDEPATMHTLRHSGGSGARANIGVIHTVHYRNNWDRAEGYKSWLERYRDRGSVDRVVVTTKAQKKSLVEEMPADFEGRVEVAGHPAPQLQSSHSESRDRFSAVVVGRLDPNKRVDLAIQALALARREQPELHLKVYGVGADEARLKGVAREEGVADAVSFLGYATDLETVFGTAGVQLFTSLFEGYGLVLTEGFAFGVPSIAFDVPYGPRDLVEHGSNGLLVESGNVAALSEALLKIVSSERRWLEFSRGAQRSALDRGVGPWATTWSNILA